MNYMSEVAKMFGVQLGEHFECDDNNWFNLEYWFTDKALMCNGVPAADSLMMLLDGTLTIKKKPWKPQYDEEYYCINSTGHVCKEKWYGDVIDTLYYKLGNCYKREHQAEANIDRWISFYRSDDVLEV